MNLWHGPVIGECLSMFECGVNECQYAHVCRCVSGNVLVGKSENV